LAVFNSNQRRNIKRERKALQKQGVFVQTFSGEKIPRAFFPLMYRYYESTNDKFGPWGCRYLTEPFFDGLYHHYRQRLMIVAAFDEKEPSTPLGMSLLVTKGAQLYGRYWGCARSINSLHFNACYYQPIEWAIANRIHRFDPGAGGGGTKFGGVLKRSPAIACIVFMIYAWRGLCRPILMKSIVWNRSRSTTSIKNCRLLSD